MAATYVALHEHGIAKNGLGARRAALQRVQEEWAQFTETSHARFKEIERNFSEVFETANQASTDQKKTFDGLIEKAGQKLDEVEQTYNEKLALLAPVTYWRDRAVEHSKRARWALGTFLLGIVAAAALIWLELDRWLLPRLGDSPATEVLYFVVITLIVTVTIVAWPLRIVSRLYFSNVHLRSDAEERVTMATTYLSLLREQEGKLSDEDRRLIFQRLFRPAATGIVRDDAMPPTWVDMVSRATSRDR